MATEVKSNEHKAALKKPKERGFASQIFTIVVLVFGILMAIAVLEGFIEACVRISKAYEGVDGAIRWPAPGGQEANAMGLTDLQVKDVMNITLFLIFAFTAIISGPTFYVLKGKILSGKSNVTAYYAMASLVLGGILGMPMLFTAMALDRRTPEGEENSKKTIALIWISLVIWIVVFIAFVGFMVILPDLPEMLGLTDFAVA